MIISLSPIRADFDVKISYDGDKITVNGDDLDFTDLPEGAELPHEAIDNEAIIGSVRRSNGEVILTVSLPYNSPNAGREVLFPSPLSVTGAGVLEFPGGRFSEEKNAD